MSHKTVFSRFSHRNAQCMPAGMRAAEVFCFTYFNGDSCDDAACPFVHDASQLARAPAKLRHIEMCALAKLGRCPVPSAQCNFAHTTEALLKGRSHRRELLRMYPDRRQEGGKASWAVDKRKSVDEIKGVVPKEDEEVAFNILCKVGHSTLSTFRKLFEERTGHPFAFREWGFGGIGEVFQRWVQVGKVIQRIESRHTRVSLSPETREEVLERMRKRRDLLLRRETEQLEKSSPDRKIVELPTARVVEINAVEGNFTAVSLKRDFHQGASRVLLPVQSCVPLYDPRTVWGKRQLSKRYSWKRNPIVCWCGQLVHSRCAFLICGCLYCRPCLAECIEEGARNTDKIAPLNESSRQVYCRKCDRNVRYSEGLCEVVHLVSDLNPMVPFQELSVAIASWPIRCIMVNCPWQGKPRVEWSDHAAVCPLLRTARLPLDYGLLALPLSPGPPISSRRDLTGELPSQCRHYQAESKLCATLLDKAPSRPKFDSKDTVFIAAFRHSVKKCVKLALKAVTLLAKKIKDNNDNSNQSKKQRSQREGIVRRQTRLRGSRRRNDSSSERSSSARSSTDSSSEVPSDSYGSDSRLSGVYPSVSSSHSHSLTPASMSSSSSLSEVSSPVVVRSSARPKGKPHRRRSIDDSSSCTDHSRSRSDGKRSQRSRSRHMEGGRRRAGSRSPPFRSRAKSSKAKSSREHARSPKRTDRDSRREKADRGDHSSTEQVEKKSKRRHQRSRRADSDDGEVRRLRTTRESSKSEKKRLSKPSSRMERRNKKM